MPQLKSDRIYELILFIRPLMKHLTDAVEFELSGTGVTIAMRAIMEQLYDLDELTVPEISRRLMLKRQSIQPVLDKLHTLGLVEKKTNPIHKKSWVFVLKEKGKDLIRSIKNREISNLEQISGEFSMKDLRVAINVLSKLDQRFVNFEQWRNKNE